MILAVETSGREGGAALLSPDGTTGREESLGEGVAQGVALAPTVEGLLAGAGIAAPDLTLVGVGLGPGSFTGVRVAVAFAKTLAFAAGVPVVGVSSLRALAWRAPPGETVICARDARRECLYLAVYRAPVAGSREPPAELLAPRLAPLGAVPALLPADALVLGDAAERFPDLLSGKGRRLGDPGLGDPSALAVGRLAAHRFAAAGPDDVHELAPVYLRIPEAEERLLDGGPG